VCTAGPLAISFSYVNKMESLLFSCAKKFLYANRYNYANLSTCYFVLKFRDKVEAILVKLDLDKQYPGVKQGKQDEERILNNTASAHSSVARKKEKVLKFSVMLLKT
jgi:hypothetical protein